MKKDWLYEDALNKIRELFEDKSVLQSETKRNLHALIEEIEVMIDSLVDDED